MLLFKIEQRTTKADIGMYLNLRAKCAFMALVLLFLSSASHANPVDSSSAANLIGTVTADSLQSTGSLLQTISYDGSDGQASASISATNYTASPDQNGVSILLTSSAAGIANSTGGTTSTSTSSVSLYYEVIAPKTLSSFAFVNITLDSLISNNIGNPFLFYDNCGNEPAGSCDSKNYGYTEVSNGFGFQCNNISADGYTPCKFGFDSYGFRIISTNTVYEANLSTFAQANGSGTASTSANFLVYGGFYSGNLETDLDPSHYQFVFGPSIASLPVYDVPEPTSLLMLSLGVLGVCVVRRRKIAAKAPRPA